MNTIYIDLANPGPYLVESLIDQPEQPALTVKLPIKPDQQEAEVALGNVTLLNIPDTVCGKLSIQTLALTPEEDEYLEEISHKVMVGFDEEAVAMFPDDLTIQFTMHSDVLKWRDAGQAAFETNAMDEAEEPAEFICSQIISVVGEDGETEELEYFILPGNSADGAIYPASVEKEGGYQYNFTVSPELDPVHEQQKKVKKRKGFLFRIFKKNSLKVEIKELVKKLQAVSAIANLEGNARIDAIIEAIKKTSKVSENIKKNYAIMRYNHDAKNFEKIDVSEINRDKKTLILIPGTFKESLSRKDNKWQGSFKFLMEKTGDFDNWFDFILDPNNSPYQQIISLEHNSVFDSLQDNVRYFIDHLQLGELRFKQPVAVLSASRGGFLAKMLASIGANKYPGFTSDNLNLNINKIVTVANGFSGYVDPRQKDVLEKKLMLLFNIVNLLTFGRLRTYLYLLSFTPEFIQRLPGLRGQAEDSDEIKHLMNPENQVKGLWCLPLANNHEKKVLFFIEESFIDPILGEKNDFVLSFESQLEVWPGQLLANINPIVGTHIHGKGLSVEKTRLDIMEFLNKEIA